MKLRNIAISDVRKNARNKIEVFEENINYFSKKNFIEVLFLLMKLIMEKIF